MFRGGAADEAYSLTEVKRRCPGVNLRKARRDGLKIRYIGRTGWCLGRDILDYLESLPTTRKGSE